MQAVLAGVPFFDEVFRQLDCTYVLLLSLSSSFLLPSVPSSSPYASINVPSVEWHLSEASTFTPITHIATVRGSARHLLLGERVALNTLARCSGIATKSRRLLELARKEGYQGIVAGTRKTTPGEFLIKLLISLFLSFLLSLWWVGPGDVVELFHSLSLSLSPLSFSHLLRARPRVGIAADHSSSQSCSAWFVGVFRLPTRREIRNARWRNRRSSIRSLVYGHA